MACPCAWRRDPAPRRVLCILPACPLLTFSNLDNMLCILLNKSNKNFLATSACAKVRNAHGL